MKKAVLLTTLLVSAFVLACPVPASAYNYGDYRSTTLISKAWTALNENDLEAVLAYTNKCIELYADQAKKMQESLTDYPTGTNEEIFAFWALNDVATGLYIQGEAFRKNEMIDEAKAAFQKLKDDYTYGQCWDIGGWFWKPAEAADEKLVMLETGSDLDFGDYSSSTLTAKAWGALSKNDLEAVKTYTDKVFELYTEQAVEMQNSLTEYPWESKEKIFTYWALNDVGTSLFIKGEALKNAGQVNDAKEAYKELVDKFYYSQCWDPNGWFWKPAEGFVLSDEFRNKEDLVVDKEIDVLIESIEDEDGRLVLSKMKAEKVKGWQKVMVDTEEGHVVEGRIVKQVKGGYMVDVDGVEGFLPMSLSSFKGYSTEDVMANKYNFQVAKINKQRRNLILSRRDIVQKEREQVREKLWGELEKGQKRKGMVKGITDFGAFIDLGGVDGLLHITDMSWSRINHPSEIVNVGDQVEVLILDFDQENSKVSLGLKQIAANPWDDIYEKYPASSKVKGKIVNIMPYGVFVEIEKGIEGLLHSSEISWQKKLVNPPDIFELGQEVEVQIINIDKDSKRISLSMKQLESNPWLEAEKHIPVGEKVKGTIRGFTDYGAFVELESGLEGMIHVSDMSWTKKINHPQDVLEKGQEVEVVVLAIDSDNRKITLGLKQLTENPWPNIAEKYPVDSESEAEVVLNSNFGVFVKLEDDVEALVYSSEIDKEKATELKPGDKLSVKIIKVDVEQMKIGVSTRLS